MRKNRWVAAVLALLTLAGCGTKTNTDKETEGQVIEKPQLITNVYTCRDLTLPEGYYINSYAGFKDGAFQFQGNYSESKGYLLKLVHPSKASVGKREPKPG